MSVRMKTDAELDKMSKKALIEWIRNVQGFYMKSVETREILVAQAKDMSQDIKDLRVQKAEIIRANGDLRSKVALSNVDRLQFKAQAYDMMAFQYDLLTGVRDVQFVVNPRPTGLEDVPLPK